MDPNTPQKNELYLLIRNNETLMYEGYVKAITAYNEKGKFDVIPLHTNFISIIKEKLIIHEKDGKNAEITLDNGILKVMENKVYVFLGVNNLA